MTIFRESLSLLFLICFSTVLNAQCDSVITDINQPKAIPEEDLLVYLPFEGNTDDQSGNGHNGSSFGGTYTEGTCGQAAAFNGNDFIYLPNEARFQPNQSITICYWMKTLQTSRFELVDQRTGDFNPSLHNFGLYYNCCSGPQSITYVYPNYNNAQDDTRIAFESPDYNNGEWHHITYTKDVENQVMKTYEDGCLLDAVNFDDVDFNVNGTLTIGKHYQNIHYYNGLLDEFMIYNRALSDEEIADLVHHCQPLQVGISEDCTICISQPQNGITYNLLDEEDNIIQTIENDCNLNICFDPTNSVGQARIQAVDENTGCTLVLDTLLNLSNDDLSLSLGPDLELCSSELPWTLDPGSFEVYNWSTNENTSTIEVNEAGIYGLSVSEGCASAEDEITISVIQPPMSVDLGEDLVICSDDLPVQIDGASSEYTVEWSTGESTPSISVNSGGVYTVVQSNECGTSTDDINIQVVESGVESQNLIFCQGDSISVNGNYYSEEGVVDWSQNGDPESDCITLIEINLIEWPTTPDSLNIEISIGEVIEIEGTLISSEGNYEINYIDDFGCYQTSFVTVSEVGSGSSGNPIEIDQSKLVVYVPNAFSPNGDLINPYFKPSFYDLNAHQVVYYELQVFSRNGQVVYASNDLYDLGWNGSNANKIDSDTFLWKLTYQVKSEEKVELTGSISLVR